MRKCHHWNLVSPFQRQGINNRGDCFYMDVLIHIFSFQALTPCVLCDASVIGDTTAQSNNSSSVWEKLISSFLLSSHFPHTLTMSQKFSPPMQKPLFFTDLSSNLYKALELNYISTIYQVASSF